MEPDARRHLDLLAASVDMRREPDRGLNPEGAGFRWYDMRDRAAFGSLVPAGRPVWRAGRDVAARQLWRRDPDPAPMRANAVPAVKEILLVDPEIGGVGVVETALRLVGDIEVCTNFQSARARLLQRPPDLLITNLRLEAYNGLHLVLLAARTRTRCIVFSTHDDIGLAREVQAAGAFFELSDRLPQVLESYVNATLPQHDRRNIANVGEPLRGGRRCTDR
jgi:ActR/RegA family two-component response regulator